MNHHFFDELNSMKPLELNLLWTNLSVDFDENEYNEYNEYLDRLEEQAGDQDLPEDYKF